MHKGQHSIEKEISSWETISSRLVWLEGKWDFVTTSQHNLNIADKLNNVRAALIRPDFYVQIFYLHHRCP